MPPAVATKDSYLNYVLQFECDCTRNTTASHPMATASARSGSGQAKSGRLAFFIVSLYLPLPACQCQECRFLTVSVEHSPQPSCLQTELRASPTDSGQGSTRPTKGAADHACRTSTVRTRPWLVTCPSWCMRTMSKSDTPRSTRQVIGRIWHWSYVKWQRSSLENTVFSAA